MNRDRAVATHALKSLTVLTSEDCFLVFPATETAIFISPESTPPIQLDCRIQVELTVSISPSQQGGILAGNLY